MRIAKTKPNAAKRTSPVNQRARTAKRNGCRSARFIVSDSISVALPHSRRQRLQVEPRQEIDCFEMPVQGRRAADLRAKIQVGAQELGDFRRLVSQMFERT